MRPCHVQDQIDFLLEKAIQSDESLEVAVSYRYISDYYRLQAELPLEEDEREVVLNVLEAYPDIKFRIDIDEISEEFDKVVTRDTFRAYREWAYRYGSKGKELDDVTPPDVGGPTDPSCQVVCDLNSFVENTDGHTINDAALAVELAGMIADKYGVEDLDEEVFNSEPYEQIKQITNIIHSFVEMKDDGRLNWNMMANTFDDIRDQTHQDIMKEAGKREVIRKLKESETDSIEVFLEENF